MPHSVFPAKRRLLLDPPNALYFPYEPGKQVRSAIAIKNTSKSRVAFKFHINARGSCFVHPASAGILAPGESIIIFVFKFVEPPENNEKPIDPKCKFVFKIMSLKLQGEMDYAPELFYEHRDQVVIEEILPVIFLDPEQPCRVLDKLKRMLAVAEATLEARKNLISVTQFGALSDACNRLLHIASKKTEYIDEIKDDMSRLIHKLEKQGDGHCTDGFFVNNVGDPTVVKTKGALTKKRCGRNRRRCSNCIRSLRTCPRLSSTVNHCRKDDDKEGSSCDENSVHQTVETNDTTRFIGTNDVGSKDCDACPSNFAVRGKQVIPDKEPIPFPSIPSYTTNPNIAIKGQTKVDNNKRKRKLGENPKVACETSGKKFKQTEKPCTNLEMKTNHPSSEVLPLIKQHVSLLPPPQHLPICYVPLSYAMPFMYHYGAPPLYAQVPLVPQMVQYPQWQHSREVQNGNGGRSRNASHEEVMKNGAQSSVKHGHYH